MYVMRRLGRPPAIDPPDEARSREVREALRFGKVKVEELPMVLGFNSVSVLYDIANRYEQERGLTATQREEAP